MNFASLFPAFLALTSISEGVYAQSTPLPLVEYTFDDSTDPMKNTGSDDDSQLTLHGILFPPGNNGISFPQNAAHFTGDGCIEVPSGDDINYTPIQKRTILLDFIWDGSKTNDEPQILFEEGGKSTGVNIFISPTDQSGTAEIGMGVWKRSNDKTFMHTMFLSTKNNTIQADNLYRAAFVLNKIGGNGDGRGTVAGYLGGIPFDTKEIDWFAIGERGSRNCIGGMREHTRILNGTTSEAALRDGLYFHGQIDNFKLYNSVIDIPISQGQTRFLRGNHE